MAEPVTVALTKTCPPSVTRSRERQTTEISKQFAGQIRKGGIEYSIRARLLWVIHVPVEARTPKRVMERTE
jgi:hypothetical protein